MLPQLLMTLERSFHPTIPACANFFIQEAYKLFGTINEWHLRFQKRCSKILPTLAWKLLRWPSSRWFHQHLPHFFSTLLIIRPCVSQRLLSGSLFFFDYLVSLICDHRREVSHSFQPFPTCLNFLLAFASTSIPLATLPCPLCSTPLSSQLLFKGCLSFDSFFWISSVTDWVPQFKGIRSRDKSVL